MSVVNTGKPIARHVESLRKLASIISLGIEVQAGIPLLDILMRRTSCYLLMFTLTCHVFLGSILHGYLSR